ncbi:MAG: YiiD C-terminal domain-containing protein [Bdellovibrionales bacterium]|nr:YiiD C-terminal domain-containing protein [Bdellovibrionales bacterium]
MTTEQMLENINNKIPITQHMGLKVVECQLNEVSIAADFEKNRNHKMTAFGGSVATVLTLSCWAWITNYLDAQNLQNVEVSIHKCQIEYQKPIQQDFVATCYGTNDVESFNKMLLKKNKGRLHLTAEIKNNEGEVIVQFQGDFVAYKVN